MANIVNSHTHPPQHHHGFTLIELVVVIVVMSILAIGSVQFISYSALGYVDTVRRSGLSSTATIVNEKISRLIRDALPGSIRISADQRCIEFIPIVAASQYTQAPIVGSPVAQTQVHTIPLDGALAQSGYLAIYPVVASANTLYQHSTNPGIISLQTASVTATVAGASVFTFNGGASFQFSQGSPQKRVYVVTTPNAFCQVGTQLFYYKNYGFIASMNNTPAFLSTANANYTVFNTVPNRQLVADKLLANSLTFSYLPSSLRRNAIVAYELELKEVGNSETQVVNQEVQIRNVP